MTKGGHTMTLKRNQLGWMMVTENVQTRAWGNKWALKQFDTLAQVEGKYKTWRGIVALVEVPAVAIVQVEVA